MQRLSQRKCIRSELHIILHSATEQRIYHEGLKRPSMKDTKKFNQEIMSRAFHDLHAKSSSLLATSQVENKFS
jgi:hypothetical protein